MRCETCNVEIVRKPHENTARWERRRFCSKRCAARSKDYSRAIYEPHPFMCVVCQDVFTKTMWMQERCPKCQKRKTDRIMRIAKVKYEARKAAEKKACCAPAAPPQTCVWKMG